MLGFYISSITLKEIQTSDVSNSAQCWVSREQRWTDSSDLVIAEEGFWNLPELFYYLVYCMCFMPYDPKIVGPE